jgi:hypothetical protein
MPDAPEMGQAEQAGLFHDKLFRRRWFLRRMRRSRAVIGSDFPRLMQRPRSPILLPITAIFGNEPYAVVGGVATASYQPERHTQDIDILIHADSMRTVTTRLRELKGQRTGTLAFPASTLCLTGETWLVGNAPPLDLLWSNAQWSREATTRALPDANGILIVPLPYLILMKIDAGRGIDQGDLTRMLGLANDTALQAVRATIARYMPDAREDIESYIEIGRIEIGIRNTPTP